MNGWGEGQLGVKVKVRGALGPAQGTLRSSTLSTTERFNGGRGGEGEFCVRADARLRMDIVKGMGLAEDSK